MGHSDAAAITLDEVAPEVGDRIRYVDHLGEWTPPGAITFGRDGQPLYCQGPRDNAAAILATLNRTVGRGNYHYVLQVRG